MDQRIKTHLLDLGFNQKLDTLFSLPVSKPLSATGNFWDVFAYFENGCCYLSTNGDLVSAFDVPDIDIDFMLKKISYELHKYGCYLNGSKIVKQLDPKNIKQELKQFIIAVKKIDNLYDEI